MSGNCRAALQDDLHRVRELFVQAKYCDDAKCVVGRGSRVVAKDDSVSGAAAEVISHDGGVESCMFDAFNRKIANALFGGLPGSEFLCMPANLGASRKSTQHQVVHVLKSDAADANAALRGFDQVVRVHAGFIGLGHNRTIRQYASSASAVHAARRVKP